MTLRTNQEMRMSLASASSTLWDLSFSKPSFSESVVLLLPRFPPQTTDRHSYSIPPHTLHYQSLPQLLHLSAQVIYRYFLP